MLKSYKTLAFGMLLAAAGVLQAADWVTLVPPGWEGIAMAATGAIVMWLRSVTNSAMASGV